MADDPKAEVEEKPKKSGKKGLMMGLVGAIILGGGGFYATFSGMILGPSGDSEMASDDQGSSDDGYGDTGDDGYGSADDGYDSGGATTVNMGDITFIEMAPLIISLGDSASAKFLRFSAQLEVDPEYASEINFIMPRITDALNTYLRAVSEEELAKPSSFDRLRAQMLRRIQVVTGQGKVRDLLITEFILG